MNLITEQHSIVNADKLHPYTRDTFTNSKDLGNNKELITFIKNTLSEESALNISIPISTMVSSSARIHLFQFNNN